MHCYGEVSNDEAIKSIAAKWGIPVVYDAARFWCEENGKVYCALASRPLSAFMRPRFLILLKGMVVVESEDKKNEVDILKNFGLNPDSTFMSGLGLMER